MGYNPADFMRAFGVGSLFETGGDAPFFTTGDVFNLFSRRVRTHPIDLTRSYMEEPTPRAPAPLSEQEARPERRAFFQPRPEVTPSAGLPRVLPAAPQ
jgi:hypothetical protein